jgi:hypothetical protein
MDKEGAQSMRNIDPDQMRQDELDAIRFKPDTDDADICGPDRCEDCGEVIDGTNCVDSEHRLYRPWMDDYCCDCGQMIWDAAKDDHEEAKSDEYRANRNA